QVGEREHGNRLRTRPRVGHCSWRFAHDCDSAVRALPQIDLRLEGIDAPEHAVDVTVHRQALLSLPSADGAYTAPEVCRDLLPGIETVSRRIGCVCHGRTAKSAGRR